MSKTDPKFSQSDVKVLERKSSFKSFLRIDQIQLKHKLFEGGWSESICRELLVRGEAVGVLLFDPLRDEIVMVRQFRVAALNQDSPWMLELVAGMVDKDEALNEVAIRETTEEANCDIIELTRICDHFSSPGVSDLIVTLFCGKIDSSNAGGVFGLADEHEDIEVVVMPYSEALLLLESGEINNAMSIIALQWLALNKEEILLKWQ